MYVGRPNYTLNNAEYTNGLCFGYVYKTQQDLNEGSYVGFYIPKILPLVDASSPTESVEKINTSIFANSLELPSSVKTANYIKVKYNGNSNFSQPVIAMGETADIFFFNNDFKMPRYIDGYNNEVRRRTDKLKMFVNSKPNSDNPADSYFVELNSIDGYINIHTSTENGESYKYDITIDTKNKFISINDDQNNKFKIITDDKKIELENSSNSHIYIDKTNINCVCKDDFTIDCKNFKVNANSSISESAKSKITRDTTKISDTASSKINIETSNLSGKIKAKTSFETPMFTSTGVLGASTLGISPTPGMPPTKQIITKSKNVMLSSTSHYGASGDGLVEALLLLLPYLKLEDPAILARIKPMLKQCVVKSVNL